MTLSALGRLRALPTIALALALAAALAGCSTSEPAKETPAPAPAEEPAAPEAPAEEEAEEPEPTAPAIDKSQLVTAQTTYSEELIDDPDTFEATYNDDGRLLSYDNANQHYAWTYEMCIRDRPNRDPASSNEQAGSLLLRQPLWHLWRS